MHSFACFLSARPNEQIYNQCSEGSKVIYVGSLAGLLPGGPGHSHQSVRDISALGAVPNLLMAEPAVEAEVHALFDYLVGTAQRERLPAARLGEVAGAVRLSRRASACSRGRGWVVRDGRDLVVFGYGPWLLSNAWHAAEELERTRGLTTRLINLPWLNRVDPGWLREAIGDRAGASCCSTTTTCAADRERCSLRPSPSSGSIRRSRVTRAASPSCRSAAPTTRCSHITASTSRRWSKTFRAAVASRARPCRSRMTVLFWDIDGTLLTTAKAGVFAWEDAVRELTGREFELDRRCGSPG